MASQYTTQVVSLPKVKQLMIDRALESNPYGKIYYERQTADLPSANISGLPQSKPFVRYSNIRGTTSGGKLKKSKPKKK